MGKSSFVFVILLKNFIPNPFFEFFPNSDYALQAIIRVKVFASL